MAEKPERLEIEQVLARRQAISEEPEYLILWRGLNIDQASWEPAHWVDSSNPAPNIVDGTSPDQEKLHIDRLKAFRYYPWPPAAMSEVAGAAQPGSPKTRLRRNSLTGNDTTGGVEQRLLENHRLKGVPGGGAGRWALRRFSHDSGVSSSSMIPPLDGLSTGLQGHSPPLPGRGRPRKSDTPNMGNTSTRVSPRMLMNASGSETSPDPIKIITDYGLISAPLTPSPSVKSPRGSPRGQGTSGTEATQDETTSKTLNSPSEKKTNKEKPKASSKSPNISPQEQNQLDNALSSVEKVKKRLSLDNGAAQSDRLMMEAPKLTTVKAVGRGAGRKALVNTPSPAPAIPAGRGRGRGRSLSPKGVGKRKLSDISIASFPSPGSLSDSQIIVTPLPSASSTGPSNSPRKRKAVSSEEPETPATSSPRAKVSKTLSQNTKKASNDGLSPAENPDSSKGGSAKQKPQKKSVDKGSATEAKSKTESKSKTVSKNSKKLEVGRKTYPSRNRQQRVTSLSPTSPLGGKSPLSSLVTSPTDETKSTTNTPGEKDSIDSTESSVKKKTVLNVKNKKAIPKGVTVKRGRPPQVKAVVKVTKKPGSKPKLGVVVKPRGRAKPVTGEKGKKTKPAQSGPKKGSTLKIKGKIVKNPRKTLGKPSAKSDLEGADMETSPSAPVTDLREILNRKRQQQQQEAVVGNHSNQPALPSTPPKTSKYSFSMKAKKAKLTLEVAKKLKTAAKRRVILQVPAEKPRAKLGKLPPRSPRKSPRIILKDVIRLSKIEYDKSMTKKRSPRPASPLAKVLKLGSVMKTPTVKKKNETSNTDEKCITKEPTESTESKAIKLAKNAPNNNQTNKPEIKQEKVSPQKKTPNETKKLKKTEVPEKTPNETKKLKKTEVPEKAPNESKKLKKTDVSEKANVGKGKPAAVVKKPPKLKIVKSKPGGKRPLTPDTSDDDVLYSINPDYDGDDSDSDLSLSPRNKKKLESSPKKKATSPRKLLLKDSIKPKPKDITPVTKDCSETSGSLPQAANSPEKEPTLKPGSPLLHNSPPANSGSNPPLINPTILHSPSNDAYKTLLKNLPNSLQPPRGAKRGSKNSDSGGEEETAERRISVRNSESAFRYKEIIVKKCPGYTQMWLFTTTKTKNALNPKVMQELSQALHNAKFDDSRLVLLSGSGSVFCSGLDLNYLLSGDRRQSAQTMADALRDFVNVLVSFPKPILAAVNGPAIGMGAAILPLCDIIYASDKASFFSPYGRLSQTPEGCSSLTFPHVMGMAMANELLLGGRKLTAIEAYQIGLVSQVFWPTSMMQEVIPRVQNMAAQSIRSLEASKLLIRSHQRAKMELTNESECRMLVERWSSVECQKAMRAYLDEELDYLM